MKTEIQTIINEVLTLAIEEVNAQQGEESQIILNEQVRFIGKEACLDSMGLATFIINIEDLLEDRIDIKIQLVTDKAFSAKQSPFYSIDTLSTYICELIEGKK